jgi:hypothetical protein
MLMSRIADSTKPAAVFFWRVMQPPELRARSGPLADPFAKDWLSHKRKDPDLFFGACEILPGENFAFSVFARRH